MPPAWSRKAPLPDGVSFVRTDVSDAAALKALMDGPADISALVNCAGIIRQQREWQAEDFSAVLNINLTATLAASTARIAKLEKAGGAIVNISSMWAYFGSALSPGYAASKSGVVALTRSMAVAWGSRGVRVNAVAPGWVDTRMGAPAKNDPERGPRITARIPDGPLGATERGRDRDRLPALAGSILCPWRGICRSTAVTR